MSTSRKHLMGVAGVLAGTLLFLSCDSGGFMNPDPGQKPAPVSMRLDSVPTSLARDDTVSVRATLLDGNGAPVSGYNVTWTSTDRQVVTVSSTTGTQAMMVGQDQGTATIAASYDQLSASATVKVHRRPTDLVYISGSGQAGNAAEQLPDSLVVRAVDRRGDPVSGVDVNFVVTSGGGSVSPAGGLTDADGRLSSAWTLGSGGTQQVQARASEAQQRVQQLKDSVVVFNAITGPVLTGLAVLPDSPTVSVGDSLQFEAMATTANGSQAADGQVSWQSTDTVIATISRKGLLKGRTAGTTRVIARTDSGTVIADTTDVTVASTASSLGALYISSPDTLQGVGDTLTLTVEARAADGSIIPNPDVQWSSLDPDVATVDTMGMITAKALGTALITAASLCCSPDTAGVVVTAASTTTPTGTLTISVPDTLLGIGDTMTLAVAARNADGTTVANPDVQWSSLNPAIATVDTMGIVTSKALGTALVVAASVCCSNDTAGVVVAPLPTVASVTVTPADATLGLAETLRLTASVKDSAGNELNGRVIRWASADTAIATVDSTGLVAARTQGQVYVTATSDGVVGTSLVVVSASSDPVPGSTDMILLDTRAGGANDIQKQTTIGGALSASSLSDDYNAFTWANDFDGAGTNAFRWTQTDPGCGDRGGGSFSYILPSTVGELYVQFKFWLSAHVGDADAVGTPGSFEIRNPSCPQPTQLKLLLLNRDPAGQIPGSRVDVIATNSGGASQISAEGFYYVSPTEPDHYINWAIENHPSEPLTLTVYVKKASGLGATDGVMTIWMNGQVIFHDTSVSMGPDDFGGFQFPATMSDPPQVETAYFWDVVAWSPK